MSLCLPETQVINHLATCLAWQAAQSKLSRFAFGPQIDAARNDGVAMTFYKSWNYTWFDPTPYFSKLTDFTVGVATQLHRFCTDLHSAHFFSQKHLRCLGSRLVALAARERYGSDERVDGGETLGNRSVGRERMEATTGWTEKKPWEI